MKVPFYLILLQTLFLVFFTNCGRQNVSKLDRRPGILAPPIVEPGVTHDMLAPQFENK